MWNFDKITCHRKPQDNPLEVKALWYTEEKTWYPMHTIKEDEKLTLVVYSRDNKLPDMTNCKWARRLTKNTNNFIWVSKIFSA